MTTIRHIDSALHDLLQKLPGPSANNLLPQAKLTYGMPNKSWTFLSSGLSLSTYLYKIALNTSLRSNERPIVRSNDGQLIQSQPSVYLDCWYLITAWNGQQRAQLSDPIEQQEHQLLSEVLLLLLKNPVFPKDKLPASLPGVQEEVPLTLIPPEEGGLSADFWSGFENGPRPFLICRITAPIDLEDVTSYYEVTTVISHQSLMVQEPKPRVDPDAQLLWVGGTIRDAQGNPVPQAWVMLKEASVVAVSDTAGHYLFTRLPPGTFQMTVRAARFVELTQRVTIPDPTSNGAGPSRPPAFDVTLVSEEPEHR